MLFNSLSFLIFFPAVTVVYFLLPHQFRWFFLLAASIYFYMAYIPAYILILIFLILVDYAAGLAIEKSLGLRRKIFLGVSLSFNISLLVFFKYYNFASANIAGLAKAGGWNFTPAILSMALPIGLSFHTFQAMSYTIEVYRSRQRAERHLGIYALYVMFYPQLVAGPIERPGNLIHQFKEKHDFNYERVTDGLKLMLWGFFKKIVIADRLAVLVNHVYASPQDHQGPVLLLTTVFFAFQIYCDFSGYTDIAIGAAQVMGFKLMKNFNRPYAADSVGEFWRRWNISLSTWFRDYLYIPLGGNRVALPRIYFNLLVTFLVSGLWHGASWTFVVWGGLNGCYLAMSLATASLRKKIIVLAKLDRWPRFHHTLKVGITFSLITFSWIFFRANSLSDAFYIVTHLGSGFESVSMAALEKNLGFSFKELALSIFFIGFLECVQAITSSGDFRGRLRAKPVVIRWSAYYILILAIIFFGIFKHSPFIYYQF